MNLLSRRAGLRKLLREWDPIDVDVAGPGAYESLTDLVLTRLRGGADPIEISDILWNELRDGPGFEFDGPQVDSMADELVMWWAKPRRRPPVWLISTSLFLLLVLGCVGGVEHIKRDTAQCERDLAAAPRTVRTDTSSLRRQLAPLGGKVVAVHWILNPVGVGCGLIPIPGSDPDHQVGVVQLTPDAVRSLVDRYDNWGEGFTLPFGMGWADEDTPQLEQLGAWIPADAFWKQSISLDAAYVGGHNGYDRAHYCVDVDHALVTFWTEATDSSWQK